jgi:hypothetical protein
MSIYFIPKSPTKGFELSTLAHPLSPFICMFTLRWVWTHRVDLNGLNFLRLAPIQWNESSWMHTVGTNGVNFNDADLLTICLGMSSSWLHVHQLHILYTNSSHPICQVARPHFVTSCQVPIPKSPIPHFQHHIVSLSQQLYHLDCQNVV